MICGKCKQAKPESEFTKINKSKDGKKGLCKDCKKSRDEEQRAKKDQKDSSLADFGLTPDLLKRNKKPKVGVMLLEKIVERKNIKEIEQSMGMNAILSELKQPYEECKPEHINEYKFVLVSLTSVMDVENLIYSMEKYAPKDRTCKVVIGGFGVWNINLLIPYIDIAVFGRAEGQINEILAGQRLANVWRKSDDPMLESKYSVRQPKYLVEGENSIGCHYRCKFCQYSHTRLAIGKEAKYDPGKHMKVQETDWNSLEIKETGHTTAWDGWSEETRLRVSKPITDKSIIDKLVKVNDEGLGHVFLKIFQIVGYPWETVESVASDVARTIGMLEDIEELITYRLTIAFLCTPFGPEPLTPMQYDSANIETNWRELLNGKQLYKGDKVHAYIIAATSGPFTLVKRMMIHRARQGDLEAFKNIVFNSKLKRMPERFKVPFLLENGYIDKDMFGEVQSAPFDYLYIDPRGV